MNDCNTKICSRCKQPFPATIEYFTPNRSKKDGLGYYCRPCDKAYKVQHYQLNSDQYKERASKRYYENREVILAHMRVLYWNDPDKYRAKSLNFHRLHRDTILPIRRQKWHENREVNLARAHQRWIDYPEHCKELSRQARLRFKSKNPIVYSAIKKATKHRRIAKQANLPATLTAHEWNRALDYFNHSCAVCGRVQGLWHTIAADHWIALNNPKCPGTTALNIIPLCHGQDGCNNSKADKSPELWLAEHFGKRKASQILKRINAYFEWVKSQG